MHPAAAAAAAAAAAVAAWVGVQVIHTYLDVILKVILGLARRTSQAGSVDLCWSHRWSEPAGTHRWSDPVDLCRPLNPLDIFLVPLFGLLGRAGLSSRVCFHKWDNRED